MLSNLPIFAPCDIAITAEKYMNNGSRLVLEVFIHENEDIEETINKNFFLDRLQPYHLQILKIEAVKEVT
jgi:hypothetical protein